MFIEQNTFMPSHYIYVELLLSGGLGWEEPCGLQGEGCLLFGAGLIGEGAEIQRNCDYYYL
jgi:hypothetical protein